MKGRPRLTPEDLNGRIKTYCSRYGVKPSPEGLPPFPAGQRETLQYREWIACYKAHQKLVRRSRGQCERCPEPAVDGSVLCAQHRLEAAAHSSNRRLA